MKIRLAFEIDGKVAVEQIIELDARNRADSRPIMSWVIQFHRQVLEQVQARNLRPPRRPTPDIDPLA